MYLKEATKSDIDEIVKIEEMSFENPWSRSSFEDELNRKDTRFIVARDEKHLLGYIILRIFEKEGYILNLAVHPEHRGKGIGKRLLKEIMRICIDLKLDKVFLEVRRSNEVAINLYRKFGFTDFSIRKRYYGKEDAIIMVKML